MSDRWSWRGAGSERRQYAELLCDDRVVGEIAFIVDIERPASLYTEVVGILNQREQDRANDEYDARRQAERDDQ